MKKLTCLKFGLFFFSLLAQAEPAPDFRLVVTGGLQGIHNGYEAFYASPLFRLGNSSPIKIKNAQLEAYAAQDTIYFSDQPIILEELLKTKPSKTQKSFLALDAAQIFGFKRVRNNLVDFKEDTLLRELGGLPVQANYESRLVGSQIVYAVDVSREHKGVYWPEKQEEIQKVNSVFATGSAGQEYYFFPRDFRSTHRTFQLIDELLKSNSSVPTRFVDLGNALTNSEHENFNMAVEMSQLLHARNPAALALGRFDLNVLSKISNKTPYIAALTGEGAPPNSRRIRMGNSEVRFLALGEISNLASGFLGKNLKSLTTRQSIENVQFSRDDVVIALGENRNSSAEAIEYSALDMVLSLSFLRGGSLPARDDINLTGNEAKGVRSVAPLVRISSSDVTEVSIWLSSPGQIKRILINRHPIVAGISTQQAFYKSALPRKEWTETEFEKLLANILLNANPNAELVMIEKRITPTPIDSSLPMFLAENLIATHGRGIDINLGGSYLKQILKAIKNNQFDLNVVVTNTLQREISEAESYNLVVSEKVLAAISDFIARESLFATSTNPSSSLQIALSESNKDAYKFLAELRKREDKASDSLDDRYHLLQSSPSMTALVRQGILQKTPLEVRPERSVLIFDISDLDIGLKVNTNNDTLLNWQTEAQDDAKASFDEARFLDTRYLNLLLYAKTGLYYLMPKLEVGLVGSLRYYQTNRDNPDAKTPKEIQNIRPGKDSVKLETEVRVPIQFYVSPLARLTYETQLWPNALFTGLKKELWPRRVHDMRLFLGMSRKPRLDYELFRVGALLGYDFSRDTAQQSFGAGFELGAAYRYNWRYFGFRIESNFRKLFPIVPNPDLGRMGVIWLTDAKIEVPIIAGFSASAVSNLTIGERMDKPWTYGVGFVFGLALSYGNRLKWLL